VYPELTDETDMLILGGDFFDRLSTLDADSAWHALAIADELTALAVEHKFLLRSIRGTFSHDRHQNRVFCRPGTDSKSEAGTEIVRAVDTLEIEHIKELDLYVLYIPADLPYNNVYDQARVLIKAHNLDKVDLVVHHGYCDHLIPECAAIDRTHILTLEQFEDLTDGFILSGHDHRPSVTHRYVSGGSFERLKHGEEEDKGFFILTVSDDKSEYVADFRTNPGASLFVTFDLTDYTESELALAAYDATIIPLLSMTHENRRVHIRTIINDLTIKRAIAAHTSSSYPSVRWTNTRSKVDANITESDQERMTLNLPELSATSLAATVCEKLDHRVTAEEFTFLTTKA